MACQTSSHTKNSCNGYEWKIVSLYEDVIDQMKYIFFTCNETQHVDVRNKLFKIRECYFLILNWVWGWVVCSC